MPTDRHPMREDREEPSKRGETTQRRGTAQPRGITTSRQGHRPPQSGRLTRRGGGSSSSSQWRSSTLDGSGEPIPMPTTKEEAQRQLEQVMLIIPDEVVMAYPNVLTGTNADLRGLKLRERQVAKLEEYGKSHEKGRRHAEEMHVAGEGISCTMSMMRKMSC